MSFRGLTVGDLFRGGASTLPTTTTTQTETEEEDVPLAIPTSRLGAGVPAATTQAVQAEFPPPRGVSVGTQTEPLPTVASTSTTTSSEKKKKRRGNPQALLKNRIALTPEQQAALLKDGRKALKTDLFADIRKKCRGKQTVIYKDGMFRCRSKPKCRKKAKPKCKPKKLPYCKK